MVLQPVHMEPPQTKIASLVELIRAAQQRAG